MKIYPTFHVSFHNAFHEDSNRQVKRTPSMMRKEFDKKLKRILDHRIIGASKKNRRTEFLVQ
ncbi:LOW QUALITY PROTEIN: hypothetical protein PanWU01x14_016260 [Parasponia andersonii]|uniref:Uncharacterized protein n=1 Tax=Parasponia andersonii TaxID=3476 RepID=A0A2P5DZM0_PARAD|nr:LOW QUALITY PROTEIN: hypothetical protein PanWU01x14_016260 [Parasponia andersonii]